MPGDDVRDRPPRFDEARELARTLAAPVVCAFASLPAAVPAAKGNEARLRHVAEALARRLAELEVGAAARERAVQQLAPFFEDTVPSPPGITGRVAFAAEDAVRFGLPFAVEDRAFVGSCAPVRILLRAAREAAPYRVVAVSVNRVWAGRGDVRGLAHEPRSELPAHLVDALGAEIDASGTELVRMAAGERAVYHAYRDGRAEREIDRERFHRVLLDGLARAFAGSELPIVLFGDRKHQSLRESLAPRVPFVGGVQGSPDHWGERELHERAWPLVQEALQREEAGRLAQLERARGRGEAVVGLQPSIAAVVEGRVRRLWLPAESSVPGRIDVDTRRAVAAWGDEDLLDALACEALRRGATVEALAPGRTPLADADVAAELW